MSNQNNVYDKILRDLQEGLSKCISHFFYPVKDDKHYKHKKINIGYKNTMPDGKKNKQLPNNCKQHDNNAAQIHYILRYIKDYPVIAPFAMLPPYHLPNWRIS